MVTADHRIPAGGPKTALVVEGGGMRGIFAAGVLDAFLEKGFDPFSLYMGVSAGACNLASHRAGQHRRNYRIYTEYCTRPQFIDPRRALRGGHFMDVDWLWEILEKELPLDTPLAAGRPGRPFVVVVTDAASGRPVYCTPRAEMMNDCLKASSALPLLFRRPLRLWGTPVVDGGIADSIPVREAVRRGARRVLILRSQPLEYAKRSTALNRLLLKALLPSHPALARAMGRRPADYRQSQDFMAAPPPGISILQVAPPAGFTVGRTTQNRKLLEEAYQEGRHQGGDVITKWDSLR